MSSLSRCGKTQGASAMQAAAAAAIAELAAAATRESTASPKKIAKKVPTKKAEESLSAMRAANEPPKGIVYAASLAGDAPAAACERRMPAAMSSVRTTTVVE